MNWQCKDMCLKVHMDDEVRRILATPERYSSMLLDVTVLRPTEVNIYGNITNTMRVNEVRRLIAMMEKQHRKKERIFGRNNSSNDTIIKVRRHSTSMEHIPGRKHVNDIRKSFDPLLHKMHRSLRNVEDRITNMKEINLDLSQTTFGSNSFVILNQQNKSRIQSVLVAGDRSGRCSQYICEHCGVIGSVKHYNPEKHRITNSNRQYDELVERIKYLENRIDEQQKRSQDEHKPYKKRFIEKIFPQFEQYQNSTNKIRTNDHNKFVYFHTPYDHSSHKKCKKCYYKRDQSTETEEKYLSVNFWKWGEDILRPGIDLKNRIVRLVTEIVSKLSNNNNNNNGGRRKFEINRDYMSQYDQKSSTDIFQKIVESTKTFSTIKSNETRKFDFFQNLGKYDPLLNQHYIPTNNNPRRPQIKKEKEYHSCPPSPQTHRNVKQNTGIDENVKLKYINPKLRKWYDHSNNNLEVENDVVVNIDLDEFIGMVSKASRKQKTELWRNIWDQAIANGQTKKDEMCIKIPILSHGKRKICEIELKIGDVEQILLGK